MSKEEQVLNIIAEILEVETVTLNTELNEENWDSLAVVTFISEIDSNFDQILSPTSVNKANTVLDLLNLVK
ncbi:Phosphopantetheine attachment site [Providencia rustigianii]|uniref:Phosphopantetheine attachment site n=1 Tax=Providencia rustigianii TaxID=158850 RepID=A0A379G8J1_9GAMM|nr:acyl carrier protein [Providencia rustigianii]SUC37287.1 Phosphopantetheine attachment site [Providencia rustigianii]